MFASRTPSVKHQDRHTQGNLLFSLASGGRSVVLVFPCRVKNARIFSASDPYWESSSSRGTGMLRGNHHLLFLEEVGGKIVFPFPLSEKRKGSKRRYTFPGIGRDDRLLLPDTKEKNGRSDQFLLHPNLCYWPFVG